MSIKVTAMLLLTLAVELSFLAYMNPTNAWRWTILMSLCQ